MKISRFALSPLTFALALCAGTTVLAADGDLELYMDGATKQIYAEPGPGRVKLGSFRPVADNAAAPKAATATASTPPPGVPVVDLAALETKVKQQGEKLDTVAAAQSKSAWASTLQLRGYTQVRYSQMLGGDQGINLWPDRSVGDANSLGDADKNWVIRRARVILEGNIGKRLAFKLEPDFASTVSGSLNVVQLREAYGDFMLTEDKVHRLRFGEAKVPYGFETLQSSSQRLAMDRDDAFSSAVRDERDTGVFYFYTPKDVQGTFSEISAAGLKHSGNFGMFALGAYNGEGANRADRNDNQHIVARLTYPWKFGDGQFFEAGVQAYHGLYSPTTGAYRAKGDISKTPNVPGANTTGYKDERVGVSAVWFPQPFGLQAEWNWGKSPQLNLATNTIEEASLDGGYIQAMYMITTNHGNVVPFVRWQYYDGANKAETNAPYNHVNDYELGLEWQLAKEVEFTAEYHHMNRTNLVTGNRAGRIDYENFDANALRFQVQFNY